MNILNSIFQGGNLGDILDEGIKDINKERETKLLLASKIEADIQQYLPDIADIWGDESVVVKVKDDLAFVMWREHWMPTTDFYKLVYENGGVVEPKDFEAYENIL